MMRRLLWVLFSVFFILTGCASKEIQQDQIHSSKLENNESETSYVENSQYNYTSLNEYSDEIGNGTTLTIPEFRINEDQMIVTFKMTFSPEIYQKITDTEKPLYVALTELNQDSNFSDMIDEVNLPYYEITTTIKENQDLNVTLNFNLIRQPADAETTELLTPSNYQLVFLNEELEIVAIYIY